jgi:hypothetical protein
VCVCVCALIDIYQYIPYGVGGAQSPHACRGYVERSPTGLRGVWWAQPTMMQCVCGVHPTYDCVGYGGRIHMILHIVNHTSHTMWECYESVLHVWCVVVVEFRSSVEDRMLYL